MWRAAERPITPALEMSQCLETYIFGLFWIVLDLGELTYPMTTMVSSLIL